MGFNFRKLIQPIVKACKNVFQGFIVWIRSMLNTDSKHLDKELEEVGRLR